MILASDLDRTLIYSQKAIAQFNSHKASELYTAEVYENKPFSFMTPKAQDLAEKLIKREHLVPVTTRIRSQYDRIRLSPNQTPQWAVIANGAEVLFNGERDTEWHAHITTELEKVSATVAELSHCFERFNSEPWFLKKRIADNWFIYALIERDLLTQSSIDEIQFLAQDHNWQLSIQGRKLYLVPNPINKFKAIEYVSHKKEASTILAAGDSLLDKPLVEGAHQGLIPAHGELFDEVSRGRYSNDSLIITKNAGIVAAEEILQYSYDYIYN